MSRATLPVGTIIQIEKSKALIAGYTFNEKDSHMSLQYFIIPFPAGYIDSDSWYTIDSENVIVISEGYQTEASSYITNYIDQIGRISKEIPYEQMVRHMEMAGEA